MHRYGLAKCPKLSGGGSACLGKVQGINKTYFGGHAIVDIHGTFIPFLRFPSCIMDAEALIHNSNTGAHDAAAQQGEGASSSFKWQASDTALLLPNQLGISKIQRAWDRKPTTPFARSGTRVGKLWKRPQTMTTRSAAASDSDEFELTRGTKRRKAQRSSPGGERKPLKKLCMDSAFGLAPRVLAWEGADSPTRKIVTRRSAANEELIALPEEDESDEVEERQADVTIEILDENGTVLDVNPEDGIEEAEWEDEEQPEGTEGDEFNETMMHLADMVDGSQAMAPIEMPLIDVEQSAATDDTDATPKIEQENQDPALSQLPDTTMPLQSNVSVVPEGFVSPIKQQQPAPMPKNRRRSFGPRRRTLPRQFAPSPLSQVMNMEDSFHEPTEGADTESSFAAHTRVYCENEMGRDVPFPGVDPQWEDIDVDAVLPPDTTFNILGYHPNVPEIEASLSDLPSAPVDGPFEELHAYAIEPVEQEGNDRVNTSPLSDSHQDLEHINTSANIPSSPIPTIEGQHPRLPLRRSPRRKSSSPRKKSTLLPSTEKPHLVAFTPIKGVPRFILPSPGAAAEGELSDVEKVQNDVMNPLERSVSAPPEEPQISPRKPVKPRVSDDTALLQAFLNRAAENKGSRRMSTQKRESITNRRDSDAVRQALGESVASPAKADVLGELDVNSPSPRKPSTSTLDTSTAFDEVINDATAIAAQAELGDDLSVGQRTRRSGRGSKRAQPSTPAAPNKISIRGNAENVVLRRTEAQEMALLTRTNTRKNKGGAVLPPLRLTKIASQLNTDADATADAQDEGMSDKPDGARGVKWAETLVEYFQGGDMSESSVLSDELNGPTMQAESTASKMEVDASAGGGDAASAPPPSETPSKPKIRRLKATRTAAAPGKTPTAPEAPVEPERLPASEAKPAAATKRRSRIATPAKGLTNASLLPSDFDPQPMVPASATESKKPAPAKKKPPPVSKLPGPASSTTTSSLGQGKENLISSPAKKKPTVPTSSKNALPTTQTFAPRLDFSMSAKLEPTPSLKEQMELVPGLMSPAKKGGRSRNVFAGGREGEEMGASVTAGVRAEVPGLSSPAKKRTRRAV